MREVSLQNDTMRHISDRTSSISTCQSQGTGGNIMFQNLEVDSNLGNVKLILTRETRRQ